MNEKIFKTLDLQNYIEHFNSFLSRPKPLFLQGDSKLNYEKILILSNSEFKAPPNVTNLDDTLLRLTKQATLHISEIYEFAKIIGYFEYLKKLKFEPKLDEWLQKIEIPQNLKDLPDKFDKNGEFKDGLDERFANLKEAYKIKKEQINSELKKLIYSKNLTPYLVDTQIHYINDSETLLLRGGFNHAIKGSVIGRSSGGFFYIFPTNISKLKNEQSEILDKKEEIIYEHCVKISSILHKNYLFLKFINQTFDTFDALSARAMMAKSYDLSFVLPDSSKDIILSEFAHPALKNPKRVSVEFCGKVLLITGVNAGGKSMLLKSIITASLLAKYLLPMSINSDKSKIGTFKNFDTIIEDPQNVKNDISTFAGRILKFSKLFSQKSILIGVDEIELGTDFEEAASLYSVMINKLMQNDMKMVITTHHKRLAMLLSKNSNVELVAALYDEEKRSPKFEFLKGVIGKSYAFETALRYGISQNLVSEAKKAYGEDKENLNLAISQAINTQNELKEKIIQNEIKSQKLDRLISNLKDQQEKNNEILQNKINKLEIEYFKAINEAKKTINLKDTKDKQRSINRANDLKKAIELPKQSKNEHKFSIGDRVKYNNIKGEIISINKNEVTILSDGIKLRVSLNSIKPSGNQAKMQQPKLNLNIQKPKNASMILDLHGLRAEVALQKVDKFISDSLLVGFDEVVIKHGIGTGKLAYAVKEFLKDHPSVKEFFDAPPNLGGFGAKIVRL